ncbi:MAG TPA: DCC1-like thiol-disulfide oxidoreductase family protein [Spongiibacteraceae bacterium]|jgi:predicted DCC family thiol-disulfide oxidoreductase YuxK|nr:DCC1-like thiol-disulfide oxidoreductase family protein [Spongiibacteraceae bacterium]HUH39010.1 DCC1-like thiol-disulfide oxidoreductase family protein [Spongiibacteraceae bacterium]
MMDVQHLLPANRHVVIFDGVCNVCNGAVNFIIKRDPAAQFAFTPVQGELARSLLQTYGVHYSDVDTFALIKDGRCFVFSSAALEIARDLTGFWYLFGLLRIVPAPVRDFIYKAFARRRYRLFGRRDSCRVPSASVKARFIGMPEHSQSRPL